MTGWLLPCAAQGQPRHVAMTLVAESARPASGEPVALAIRAVPQPGWHGYWRNPGDAGVATRATWTLPAGTSAGALDYPVPSRLLVAGLMNHVYERPWALLTTLTVPAGLATGTPLPIRVRLDYLVCTESICVPESQELATRLTVGDGAVAPARRAQFDAWRRALPRPLGSVATWQDDGGRFRLSVPYPRDAPLGDAWFYPVAAGAIDYAAPQTVTRDGDRVVIETKAAAAPASGRIEGVLASGDGTGLALIARPGAVAPASDGGGWRMALAAFAGAVLGGLLLNVMPCVFPILSLKALGLARSGEGERQARAEALAYAAGVILVCLALGATLLGLRAGGASAGWAFQLQDPRVVGMLLLLVVAIALNLAGLFELPTPAFAGRSGTTGAFMTGALAAFVATPCTGPFMGAALGAALVLPAAAALLVFAGLGLGIALPFLAVGFVPALRRRMPRPGLWMVTLRRLLSVPMFLTALALAWVLGRQAGVDGMALGLAAALLTALGLWWTGRRQHGGAGGAWVPAAAALLLATAGVATVRPARGGGAAVTALPGAEPFSEARLAALRAQGRPVFAYFTADWCLTCKVNEKAAIETAAVADAFARGKVAVLVGDWTDGDPALGRFIEAHNRAGVPLYLWYAPAAPAPRVLPQVLTGGMLTALPGGRS
ncbi:MAG: thiol:disulfide interchange protein [Sphingomonas taxi]|uniref:Thiol:disulfide interchange protein n=1 Tax=Sphingomonas taxi TaxID=1549858 RepID=A0A2W5P292_9SPHN|nr:MAG: thiol:disulfide interchange protein [Sphingomonas taxi]